MRCFNLIRYGTYQGRWKRPGDVLLVTPPAPPFPPRPSAWSLPAAPCVTRRGKAGWWFTVRPTPAACFLREAIERDGTRGGRISIKYYILLTGSEMNGVYKVGRRTLSGRWGSFQVLACACVAEQLSSWLPVMMHWKAINGRWSSFSLYLWRLLWREKEESRLWRVELYFLHSSDLIAGGKHGYITPVVRPSDHNFIPARQNSFSPLVWSQNKQTKCLPCQILPKQSVSIGTDLCCRRLNNVMQFGLIEAPKSPGQL